MNNEYHGCWPTMITPFTEDNKVDYRKVKELTNWYIDRGCDGIFAVCQSSEMFHLSQQEKIDIAKVVKESAGERVKVIASGHTSDEHHEQVDELGRMAETGVDAVVLVSNRMAKKDESEEIFQHNAEDIFRQLPSVVFGLYECPFPYLRLLSNDFLHWAAHEDKLVFLKDVSCSLNIQKQRVEIVKGTDLALFNANTATVLDSWNAGYDGYNGVMANFHIDIYKWLYENYDKDTALARKISDFLTIAAITEARAYPVNAKYHFAQTDIPMSLTTRTRPVSVLTENAQHEIASLIRMERSVRSELGLPL